MPDAVTETIPPAEKPFNVQEYMRTENEKQQATRDGKPMPAQPAAEPVKPAVAAPPADDADGDHPGMSARDRRDYRKAIRDAAEQKGRADALELLLKSQGKPTEQATPAAVGKTDDEPKRDQFASDAEYAAAVARWTVKQETESVNQRTAAQSHVTSQVEAANAAFEEHAANIPDFDKIFEKASTLDLNSSHNAFALFALSDLRAPVAEHFVNHPEDFEKLIAYEDDIQYAKILTNQQMTAAERAKSNAALIAQVKLFNRIEGKAESVYNERQKSKTVAKPTLTAAELDAKKAKPSESSTPRGGTATDGTIPMMLENGKDINPAWLAAENAKRGVRP